MRSFFATLAFIGIAAACGGSVQSSTHDNPPCGDKSGACTNGAACSETVTECGVSREHQCSCVNSLWSCDHNDCHAPNGCEVGGVQNGDLCSSKGAQCTPAEIPKCGDAIPPCTCDGTKWICTSYKCPPCPSPSTVKQGESCLNAGLYANCPGFDACNQAVTCTCVPSGGNLWQCGGGGVCVNDGGPIDAGGGG